MSHPAFGTAPIRCGRTRCKWRGFETDLVKAPGTMGGISCTQSTCPVCGCNEYMFMKPGEIKAWERAKAAAQEKSRLEMAARNGEALQAIGHALGLPCGADLHKECIPAIEALKKVNSDKDLLDFLDQMNARLNAHYGSTYGWEMILSPHVTRLMWGPGGNGHVAAIDLNDSRAQGATSCRDAIAGALERLRAREGKR